jgi:hypothetical protein
MPSVFSPLLSVIRRPTPETRCPITLCTPLYAPCAQLLTFPSSFFSAFSPSQLPNFSPSFPRLLSLGTRSLFTLCAMPYALCFPSSHLLSFPPSHLLTFPPSFFFLFPIFSCDIVPPYRTTTGPNSTTSVLYLLFLKRSAHKVKRSYSKALLPTHSTILSPQHSVLCLLPSVLCLLPSDFCPLPSALCLLPSDFCHLTSALCPLPSVFRLLFFARKHVDNILDNQV